MAKPNHVCRFSNKENLNWFPGGVLIDPVANLPLASTTVDIDWSDNSRIIINGGMAFYESQLSAQEVALCCYAVWFGDGTQRMGAVAQDKVVGIAEDSKIAWHLMVADGHLGEIVYGHGCHGHVFENGEPGYKNPYLAELSAIRNFDETMISRLVTEFYSESIYQVFLNYDAVSFSFSGRGERRLVPKVEFNAAFGAKADEQSVLKDGAEAIKRFPLQWAALQHFAECYSGYEHKYPSFDRVRLYAALIGLFRRLRLDGAELKCPNWVKNLYEQRELRAIPWASYAIRHESLEQSSHAVAVELYKKLRKSPMLLEDNSRAFKMATLGMQYSQKCGDPALFYFFKSEVQRSLPYLRDNELPATRERIQSAIQPLIHDCMARYCFNVAARLSNGSEKEDFQKKALELLQKGVPFASVSDLAHLIRVGGDGFYTLGEFEKACDRLAIAQDHFAQLQQHDWAAYCAKSGGASWERIAEKADGEAKQKAYQQAQNQYMRAIEFRQQQQAEQQDDVRSSIASHYKTLADMYFKLGDWHPATGAYQAAADTYKEVNISGWAAYCANCGGVASKNIAEQADGEVRRKAYRKARDLFTQAIELWQHQQTEGSNDVQSTQKLALYYKNLAYICFNSGEWQAAIDADEAATAIYQEIGNVDEVNYCATRCNSSMQRLAEQGIQIQIQAPTALPNKEIFLNVRSSVSRSKISPESAIPSPTDISPQETNNAFRTFLKIIFALGLVFIIIRILPIKFFQSTPVESPQPNSSSKDSSQPEPNNNQTSENSFPKPNCGDPRPDDPKAYPVSFYPVYVDFTEGNLRTVKSDFCMNAFPRIRLSTGERVIQVASFTDIGRANSLKELMIERFSSGEVGQPTVISSKNW